MHVALRRSKVLVGIVASCLLVYALLFHSRAGLGWQCYLVERYQMLRYGRLLVPWLLQKEDASLRNVAATVLKDSAVHDLRRSRELVTALVLANPDAEKYQLRGVINEMWGAYASAASDYQEAIRLRTTTDHNLNISLSSLSASVSRATAHATIDRLNHIEGDTP